MLLQLFDQHYPGRPRTQEGLDRGVNASTLAESGAPPTPAAGQSCDLQIDAEEPTKVNLKEIEISVTNYVVAMRRVEKDPVQDIKTDYFTKFE